MFFSKLVVVVVVVVVGRLIYLSPGVESRDMCIYTCIFGKLLEKPYDDIFHDFNPWGYLKSPTGQPIGAP